MVRIFTYIYPKQLKHLGKYTVRLMDQPMCFGCFPIFPSWELKVVSIESWFS